MPKFFMYTSAALLCLCLWGAGASRAALAHGADGDLVLKSADGVVLFSCPAREGLTFGIRYIHSVAQSPVEDWFCVSQQTIFLEKTVYQDFGAGLPHEPAPGQTMSTGRGHIVISGYHKALPSFDVRVGRIAQHTLLLPHGDEGEAPPREIPLDSLARPGSAITFTLASRSGAEAPDAVAE